VSHDGSIRRASMLVGRIWWSMTRRRELMLVLLQRWFKAVLGIRPSVVLVEAKFLLCSCYRLGVESDLEQVSPRWDIHKKYSTK